ncbi:MAG: hypothetical protein ACRDM7_07755 [Thermoleophilaceae bacterium]
MATIRSLLRDRVTLQVRSVDRLFLQAYVPKLMSEGLVIRFLLDRGFPIPSPALLGKIGAGYVRAIERFAARNQIPVVRFQRRESKEEVARPYFEQAEREGRFGVIMIGVAQERARVWAGWRQGGSDGHPHFAFGWQSRVPNHYYFYVRDRQWGRAFVKCCCYAPYPLWLCLNGHEWAKRQAEQAGIGYRALDNGFRSCADAEALAAICARLSARDVWGFFRRWQRILPSPMTADDRRRGYRYQLAFRQLELSDTRVFDRPQAGRDWFEQTIRDQLTLGRPDHVAIVFNRRISSKTPARFWTRVINRGVECGIQVHYRASKVKQYFKEGRALRTETTINDSYDFGIGRLVTEANWQALVRVGHEINERLLDAQLQACACAPDAATLERVVLPTRDEQGQPAPALRFGDPRVQALLASLCSFTHLLDGVTNGSLRTLVATRLPGYTPRQMTYDLRRLRRNGFLVRIERSNRYRLTAEGRRLAVFFAKTYARVLTPALAELDPALPAEIAARSPLASSWRNFEQALDARIRDAALAA